jgi:hypothetical protein
LLFSRSVAREKCLEKRFARAEIRLPQAVERSREISPAMFCSVRKNSERPQDRQAAAFGDPTPVAFIDQQSVGREFQRKSDRGQLSWTQPDVHRGEIAGQSLNLQDGKKSTRVRSPALLACSVQ